MGWMTYVYAIEEHIAFRRLVFKQLDVLEDLLIDLHAIVVPDGILTKEVEDEVVRRLKRDVLVS